MNGRLICVSGQSENLYPSDGGHIIVENIDFAEGWVVKSKNMNLFRSVKQLVLLLF